MKRLLTGLALAVSLYLPLPALAGDMPGPIEGPIPAGAYTLDLSHASLIFRVNHLGFSHYTARFKRMEASLDLDPAKPEDAALKVSVDTKSLETDYPFPDKEDFNAKLIGPEWLDAKTHPVITFTSTTITKTGDNTADVTGDLSLKGVTKPVTLSVTYNGGYAGHPFDPAGARIGFSGHGTLKRSDFGVSYGIPAPGTTFGVGDDVEIIVEAEFTHAKPNPAEPATAEPVTAEPATAEPTKDKAE